ADLILDMVGGSYINRNIKTLVPDGRMVHIAFLEGPVAEVNFAMIMAKRLTVTGSTLRPQSDLSKARMANELREHVWPLLNAGKLQVVMDSTFALEDAAKAHAWMETSNHIGKIVLKV
ncbi:MAG: zinc-binding dehydrogenase, partial [Halocynthiibacter sp.]